MRTASQSICLSGVTELLESYRDLLDTSPDVTPVFFPPMQYGYMTKNGNGTHIFALSENDSSFADVTESVAQNAEQLSASYGVVRSAENAMRLEKSLSKAKQIQSSGPARSMARVAVEDVRLSCEWEERISLFPFIMMAKHGTVEHKNGIPLQDKDRMDADLLLPAIFCIICQPLILNMTICIHILRLANQISCLS